jgi:photosystem II stability/assembly factor-like uncharacterized protein
LYPGGIFCTENHGREWTPINAPPNYEGGEDISGCDFTSAGIGKILSVEGKVGLLDARQAKSLFNIDQGEFAGPRYVPSRRLKLSGPDIEWIVGDDGQVYRNDERSERRDGRPVGQVELSIGEQQLGFNFTGLAVRGAKVWIAGSPGSVVFHSDDDGKSWNVQSTRQMLPINSLCFVDDDHGWAVGALGTILATDDGGQTWRRQRAGGDHLALLGIFSEAGDVPLELFAKASASDGYLSAVELLNRRDLESPSRNDATLAARANEALVMLGAQGVNSESRFPLRQRGLDIAVEKTTAVWDQIAGGKGLDQLEARLVRQIRTWRPEVVVVSDVDEHTDSVRQLLQRVTLQAIDHAADQKYGVAANLPLPLGEGRGEGEAPSIAASPHPNPLPKGEGTGNSDAWHVKRVYAVVSAGQSSAINITSSQLAPRLACSLAEATSAPRGVLFDEFSSAPEAVSFRQLRTDERSSSRTGDLFVGLNLQPGGGARRMLAEPTGEAIDALRRTATQRHNLQAILKHSTDSSNRWLAQIGPLTANLDESSAGELLFQLGWQSYHTGQWEAAEQAMELLSTQYPHHPLTPSARLWLLQYYTSTVAADRTGAAKLPNLTAVLPAVANLPIDSRAKSEVKLATAVEAPNGGPISAAAESTSHTVPPAAGSDPFRKDAAAELAVELGRQIERADPALFAEPAVRFPLAAAYRKLGLARDAERCLSNARFGPHDAWWICAEGEYCLAQNRGMPPKSVWKCAPAVTRPRLDGILDDAVWQKAQPVELHSAIHDDADWPASAMMAYDQQFLYLAVRCREAAETEYPPADGVRPRNADLGRRDRIDLLLSPDRDYATWYRISIDHRGWVNTNCWGSASWRPNLFVAAATADGAWTAEAAIPWSELVDRPPTNRRQPWTANIQRIIPGVGFQSWSQPATIGIRPEGFGYLEFD